MFRPNTDTSLCDTLVLWWKPWGNNISQAAHIHAKVGQLSWQSYFGLFAIILRTFQQVAAKDPYNHGWIQGPERSTSGSHEPWKVEA